MPYASGRVIHDADAHIMEVPGFLTDHLEARYRTIITDEVLFPTDRGRGLHKLMDKNSGTDAAAVDESIQSCRAVRACFPRMQAEGARLAGQGIRFTDLTQVFADHPEPIYVDTCCHVAEVGDILMARAIAARIRSNP